MSTKILWKEKQRKVKMDINNQIKKYRANMKLTQEELADKIFVTRQTISNWENGKSYPDINSLLLLSKLFDLSLDQLIKGDIELMKEDIKSDDIKTFNFYGKIFTILLVLTIILTPVLLLLAGIYGKLGTAVLFIITMLYAIKVEKLKKQNDIQTYKEILAFTNGERLDDILKHREYGKRPYQKILLAISSAIITIIASAIVFGLFILFRNI